MGSSDDGEEAIWGGTKLAQSDPKLRKAMERLSGVSKGDDREAPTEPEPEPPSGELGPVEDFTISISPEVIAAAMGQAPAAKEPARTPEPRAESSSAFSLPEPAPGGLDDGDEEADSPSPETMALMFEGLDELGVPSPPAAPTPAPAPAAESQPDHPTRKPRRSVAARDAWPSSSGSDRTLRPRSSPRPDAKRPRPVASSPRPSSMGAPTQPAARSEHAVSAKAPGGSIDELLALAADDPEQDSASALGLLDLAGPPPVREDTIDSDALPRPPVELMSIAEAPPVGEGTIGSSLQLVDEPLSTDEIEPLRAVLMPGDFVEDGEPRSPQGLAPPEPLESPRRTRPKPSEDPITTELQVPPPGASPGIPVAQVQLEDPQALGDLSTKHMPAAPSSLADQSTRHMPAAPSSLGDQSTRHMPAAPSSLGDQSTRHLPAEQIAAALAGGAAASQPETRSLPQADFDDVTVARAPKPEAPEARARRETYTPDAEAPAAEAPASEAPAPKEKKERKKERKLKEGESSGKPKLATAADLGLDGDEVYKEPILKILVGFIGISVFTVFVLFLGAVLFALL